MRAFVFGFTLAFIFSAPVFTQEPPRIVTVTVLVDGTDNVVTTMLFLHDVFFGVSKVFQKEFGVKFKIVEFNAGLWHSPSNDFDGNEELVRIAELAFSKESDIVVAFTTKNFYGDCFVEIDGDLISTKKQFGGLAVLGGRHSIVHLEERSELVLIHELGHLFGATHSLEPNSIMNADEIKTLLFDSKTKEVINANRNRNF